MKVEGKKRQARLGNCTLNFFSIHFWVRNLLLKIYQTLNGRHRVVAVKYLNI